MRCEICGEGEWRDGLPDWLCWDATALPHEVDEWVRRIHVNQHDGARRFLASIGSPATANALRAHLGDGNPRVLGAVITSLGWSGDGTDREALLSFIDHEDKDIRRRAMESLAELNIRTAVGPLASRLDIADLDGRERNRLLECLAWLRYEPIAAELRPILRSGGLCQVVGRKAVAESLALVGGAEDRAEMARIAIARLERSAAGGYVENRFQRAKDWDMYVHTVGAIAPGEVAEAESKLSDEARLALTWYPYVAPTQQEETTSVETLTVPRRSIAGFTARSPAEADQPPAKFFGQPDWRERPQWPIGGDGSLLMFYAQLPIPGERTAYLFTAGPDEWEPLGPGSALIVQPGGHCHLPTVERTEGPRSFEWRWEQDRFIPRARRVPQDDRFVMWADGKDPSVFSADAIVSDAEWNKIGGVPVWLQGDDTPAGNWEFAFQFEAGRAGSERGDGAIFYGWINEAGEGALGWQCH